MNIERQLQSNDEQKKEEKKQIRETMGMNQVEPRPDDYVDTIVCVWFVFFGFLINAETGAEKQ